MANQVWSSRRLVYCAVEPEHEKFFLAKNQEASNFLNAAPLLPVPQGTKGVKGLMEYLNDKSMLAAVVSLPAPPAASETASGETAAAPKPIPIGTITLSAESMGSYHRHSMIGISLAKEYQGQGYGSEAIAWVLNWGFQFANLHRIELGAFEWNTGAIRLYERLGFVRESRKRDHLWYNGRYWDMIELGMLEHEWRARYAAGENAKYLLPDAQEPTPAASE